MDKPPPKKTIPSKRELICEAALNCYLKNGVGNTSLSSVAKAAKVPHTLVLYYYPTMDGLFHDIVLKVLETLKDVTLRAIEENLDDPRKMMIAYVWAPFIWARDYPGFETLWCYFYYQTRWSQEILDLNSSIRKLGRERISAMIYEGIAKKIFQYQNDRSVDAVAFQIQSLITGALLQAYTENNMNKEQIAEETAKSALELIGDKPTRAQKKKNTLTKRR